MQTAMQPPTLPPIPYISLPDRHLSNYFTEERIRKHLLQAGLLSKDGRIVTEAEYENKQTDIAIKHENQRKRDEAILQVLNELGEQQNKLANNRLEMVKKDLLYQFQRIEEQYSRRLQPIRITITHEGRVEQKSVIPPRPPAQKPIGENKSQPPRRVQHSGLPPIIASPNFSNELESIRQKIDELIHNQSMLGGRLNILSENKRSDAHLWVIQDTVHKLKEKQDSVEKQQETWQQTREDEEKKFTQVINQRLDLLYQQSLPSTVDQQQIDQLISTSTIIKNLYNNISNLQNLIVNTPVNSIHATIDAAIATSERRLIEQLTRDMSDKFHQLGAQIAELRALSNSITSIDVQNLILDAMRTVKPTERSNNELETLGRTVNDRITQLEKRLNDFSQSIHSCVTRSTVDDLIRQAISNNQLTASQTPPTSQVDIGLQKRITSIEQRLDIFAPVEDLRQLKQRLTQLENQAGDHTHSVSLAVVNPSPPLAESITKNTAVYVEDPRVIPLQSQVDKHASSLQDLHAKINELKRTEIDLSGVHQLVNASEAKTREAVNDLAKYVHRECEDTRVPGVINEFSKYTTIINNLTNQINGLEHNKPDLKTVERLIRDSEERMAGTTAPSVIGDGQPDPRIPGLQTQINGHFGLIQNLENQLEQFRQMKPDQQVVQQLINESERRTKTVIENLPKSMPQEGLDSRLSDVLQQIDDHAVSIQDLNDRINQLPNIQSNAELLKKVNDNEHEVKRTQKDLAVLRDQLAHQPASTSQPQLPPPTNENSLTKQYTDEDLQAVMPFVEILPTFNLFSANEWD